MMHFISTLRSQLAPLFIHSTSDLWYWDRHGLGQVWTGTETGMGWDRYGLVLRQYGLVLRQVWTGTETGMGWYWDRYGLYWDRYGLVLRQAWTGTGMGWYWDRHGLGLCALHVLPWCKRLYLENVIMASPVAWYQHGQGPSFSRNVVTGSSSPLYWGYGTSSQPWRQTYSLPDELSTVFYNALSCLL